MTIGAQFLYHSFMSHTTENIVITHSYRKEKFLLVLTTLPKKNLFIFLNYEYSKIGLYEGHAPMTTLMSLGYESHLFDPTASRAIHLVQTRIVILGV
jgi:hypothetical protein